MNFKIGDRIIALGKLDDNYLNNKIGTIIYIGSSYCSVEFDEHIDGHNGHNCDGKYGHCWNCRYDKIKLIVFKTSIEKTIETEIDNLRI